MLVVLCAAQRVGTGRTEVSHKGTIYLGHLQINVHFFSIYAHAYKCKALFDFVEEGVAGKEVADVLQSGGGNVRHGFAREERLVGREQHIIKGEQACEYVVLDDGIGDILVEVAALFLIDIETGRADMARLEPIDEGFGVDESATTGVDNHHPLLHLGDGFGVDEVVVVLGERAVQGDDVRFAQKGVEGDILHVVLGCVIVVGIEVVAEDTHAEPLEDLDEDLGYFARSDNANGLAIEVKAHEPLQGEVAIACASGSPREVAVEGKDKSECELGNGMGRVCGYTDYANARLGCRGEVHIVEARTAEGNETDSEPSHLGQDIGREGVVDKTANDLGTLHEEDVVHVGMGFVVFDFKAVKGFALFVEEGVDGVEDLLVVLFSTKEGDTGHKTVNK